MAVAICELTGVYWVLERCGARLPARRPTCVSYSTGARGGGVKGWGGRMTFFRALVRAASATSDSLPLSTSPPPPSLSAPPPHPTLPPSSPECDLAAHFNACFRFIDKVRGKGLGCPGEAAAGPRAGSLLRRAGRSRSMAVVVAAPLTPPHLPPSLSVLCRCPGQAAAGARARALLRRPEPQRDGGGGLPGGRAGAQP